MRTASFSALGTTVVVAVTASEALPSARDALERALRRLDETCSRFRPDSELSRANARSGEAVEISPLLAELLEVALHAAERTNGLAVPTLGAQLRSAGYDRTYALVRARGRFIVAASEPVASWRTVRLDRERLILEAPRGVELDLGATAKAWAADDAAHEIAVATGAGVLVSLGGDVAVAGPSPAGGWAIRIDDDHAAPLDGAGPVVSIGRGGIATSSTAIRTWRTDRGHAHHLIDPRTGRPAESAWRTVTVSAPTSVDANVAATASFMLDADAPAWLAGRRLAARLVDAAGVIVRVGGWPTEAQAA